MKYADHLARLAGFDYTPRDVERHLNDGTTGYYAWTATYEGPVRSDYPAARADLADNQRGMK